MKKLALALSALVLVACGRATDQDVDEGIGLWAEVTDGYLKVLETHQATPKKAIEEGQKFLDTDPKMQRLAKIGNKQGTSAQQDRFAKAVEKSMESISSRMEAIQKAMLAAGDEASANALDDQWRSLIERLGG